MYEKIYRKGKAPGTDNGLIQGPEGEYMGNTHGSRDRSKPVKSSLGIALGAILVSKVEAKICSTDILLGEDVGGKLENN